MICYICYSQYIHIRKHCHCVYIFMREVLLGHSIAEHDNFLNAVFENGNDI